MSRWQVQCVRSVWHIATSLGLTSSNVSHSTVPVAGSSISFGRCHASGVGHQVSRIRVRLRRRSGSLITDHTTWSLNGMGAWPLPWSVDLTSNQISSTAAPDGRRARSPGTIGGQAGTPAW